MDKPWNKRYHEFETAYERDQFHWRSISLSYSLYHTSVYGLLGLTVLEILALYTGREINTLRRAIIALHNKHVLYVEHRDRREHGKYEDMITGLPSAFDCRPRPIRDAIIYNPPIDIEHPHFKVKDAKLTERWGNYRAPLPCMDSVGL